MYLRALAEGPVSHFLRGQVTFRFPERQIKIKQRSNFLNMKTGIKNLSLFLKRKTNVLGRKKMIVKYLDLSFTWHRKTGWQCIWIASLWEISNQYNSNWMKYNLLIQKAVYLTARCTALWTIALCSRRYRCRWNARSGKKIFNYQFESQSYSQMKCLVCKL